MSVKEYLRKLVAFGSKPNATTFPELPDVAVWLRSFLAIAYAWHLRGKTGGAGFLLGVNLITFLPFIYFSTFLGVDADSYENLTFAGVPNCLALFLLVWIYFYTLDNENDEAKMVGMLNILRTVTAEDSSGVAESIMQDAPDAGETGSEF